MANIKITNYEIKSTINKKIVLISDIHYYSRRNLNKLESIYGQIKILNPNYICIAGDFIDGAKVLEEDLFVFFLKKLSKIGKVILSLGNHDITIKGKVKTYFYNEELFNKIKRIRNVYLLDNETKVIDDICFIGLNLGFNYYYKEGENSKDFVSQFNNIKKINNKNYNILLCHSPLIVTQNDVVENLKNIDLVLCGHTHGGMTPTIFQKYLKNRVFISPDKKRFFLNDAYGHIVKDTINIVVSSGVTKLSHASRINNLDFLFKPEVVLIELKKES